MSNVDKHTVNGETPIRLCNYTDVYYRNAITPDIEFMEASALPREIEKFELRKGDVLITKDSESWTDIAVPAYVEGDLSGVLCGYHLAQIRPYTDTLRGEYLFRAFQAEPIAYQFRVATNGVTRYGLSSDGIAASLFPVPSQAEQDAIIVFLNRLDQLVNRLVSAKQRLIELLNEQKQAIIHRAVTRGLDPNAPMKPTVLDWLPEVPEHWTVAALRLRYSVELGKMLDAKRITGKHSVPYLRNVDVQWDRVNTSNLPVMDIEPREYARYTLQPGDMLVCEGGEVGRSAFWNAELPICGFQKALHRVRAFDPERDWPRFLYYLMYAVSKLGVFQAGGSENTIAHLTGEKLRAYRFPFPPPQEQEEIARHLDDATQYAEAAIQRAHREIELIREYRTRLISDVVTGKLDVRGVELPGPDEEGVEVRLDGLESVATEGSPDSEEIQDAAFRYQ